jgi:hypothetical protein
MISRQPKKKKSNSNSLASSLITKLVSRSNTGGKHGHNPAPRNLESALSYFAKGDVSPEGLPIPDYRGFKSWVNTQSSESIENSFVFNRLHRGNDGHYAPSVDLMEEMRIQKGRYESLLKTDQDGNPERFANYNKYKLLISVFSEDQRSIDFSAALDKFTTEGESQDFDFDLCTQAELRIRFFDSLQRRNWRQAFLLLGKLKKLEHDPGEVAYLTSLAYFESDEFSDSIKHASQVQPDHPDYFVAAALWLESLAFLGDIKEFAKRLKVVGSKRLSPMYLRYLLQIIMSNANDPTEVPKVMEIEMGDAALEMAEVDVQKDPFLPAFNRYSCEIGVRVAEYLAIEELESSLNSDAAEDGAENEEEISAEVLRLTLPLCAFDSLLWGEILESKPNERFIPIVKRLLNAPYKVSLNDHLQALKAQLRLGGALNFIQNTARMLESLTGQDYDRKLFVEIVQAAYIQATVLSSDLESKFKDFLSSVPGNIAFSERHQADVARLKFLSTLSTMGRQSYEWAEAALNTAEENTSSTIRDAGMISLGFFRIFELELNSRMLLPLRNNPKGAELLDAKWFLVHQQLKDLKAVSTKNKIKSIDKCIKVWDRLVHELKKVMNGESSGLELGSLEYLLSKTSSLDGPDLEFKAYMANLLSQRFTQSGLLAHSSGALGMLISGDVRERFRNPPAHTRFLPLSVARECKKHVDSGLKSLAVWLC